MSQLLDRLERVRGLPVLLGAVLVLLNLVVRLVILALVPEDGPRGILFFLLTDGNLLLHLGIIVGLLGVLVGDVL
jgi:hypothetical protein